MTMNFFKQLTAQPRLVSAALSGCIIWLILPHHWRSATRMLAAWDFATGIYLVLALSMMARSTIAGIRSRAALHDEGQFVILGLTTVTAIVSVAGIMIELATAKTHQTHEGQHIVLAALTVFLSWTFLHTIYAVHYAHEYYSGPDDQCAGGLEFPGHEPPDYWDFMYYSFVIGTACATADVNTTCRRMRRITALHCIVAFFFNTTILALTVNIGAGFF